MNPTDVLRDFVEDRAGFSFRNLSDHIFELISGQWQGGLWTHQVVVVQPDQPAGDTIVIYITGGDPNSPDIAEAQAIADSSGLRVALLFHIPNQPLFDLWEDDLIAHTFDRFLQSGDTDWPLLFPMTRAAVRCMDMLESIGFENFVVVGASKRGWTTWLAAATGDTRIVGIAPMVIDNLDFPAQMAHQVASWGGYSEQISDYTNRDLQDRMDSDRGMALTTMMDPISYVDRISCPILIVNGSNDRYWTVDALSIYWNLLPATTRCLIVPNAGHILGNKIQMIETVSAFASACDRGTVLPSVEVTLTDTTVVATAPEAHELTVWAAFSETRDFRDSLWSVVATESPVEFEMPDEVFIAGMLEARFLGPTGPYSLSTPVQVILP